MLLLHYKQKLKVDNVGSPGTQMWSVTTVTKRDICQQIVGQRAEAMKAKDQKAEKDQTVGIGQTKQKKQTHPSMMYHIWHSQRPNQQSMNGI